jgi:hypothetical protein
MPEASEHPYQPRNPILRDMKAALRRGMSLLGMHSVIAGYPKFKEHALMHWLRWRRVLWPWMRKPWRMRTRDLSAVYLTSRSRWDGPGSQILATLSNICFAEFTGVQYVHTPFQRMSHAPAGMTDEECAQRWEKHLDLGSSYAAVETVTAAERVVVHGARGVRYRTSTLNVLNNCHSFTDRYPQVWLPVLERIKRQRWAMTDMREGRPLIVAAHARRGDVPASETLRYTSDTYLASTLGGVAQVLSEYGLRATMHVYSEGREEDFAGLRELDVTLHLDGDQIGDWEALRAADVLIVSRSAYSYSAALLSDGIILCPRFWHEPLPGWVRVGRDGGIPEELLRSKIRNLAG